MTGPERNLRLRRKQRIAKRVLFALTIMGLVGQTLERMDDVSRAARPGHPGFLTDDLGQYQYR